MSNNYIGDVAFKRMLICR